MTRASALAAKVLVITFESPVCTACAVERLWKYDNLITSNCWLVFRLSFKAVEATQDSFESCAADDMHQLMKREGLLTHSCSGAQPWGRRRHDMIASRCGHCT